MSNVREQHSITLVRLAIGNLALFYFHASLTLDHCFMLRVPEETVDNPKFICAQFCLHHFAFEID